MTAAAAGTRQHDVRDAGIRLVFGLAVVFAVMVLGGWLVTGPLAHLWPLRVEDGVDRSLSLHRNQVLDSLSGFFSTVAGTTWAVVLGAAAFIAIRMLTHRWAEAVFVAAALLSEAGVFLATTLVVERSRPAVPRLDAAPPTSSFPSGHVAAAVALYTAVALVARRHGAAWPVWSLLAVPVAVGFSRLYRGMHHPSDVVAGALLGVLCVLLAHRAVLGARSGVTRPDRR